MKDDTLKLILMAGGAYALYWYLNHYSANGNAYDAQGNKTGATYWDQWFSSTPTVTGTPAKSVSTTGGASTTPPATSATTVQLNNTSNPNGAYRAGDYFQLVITGPPNSPVTGAASQNGGAVSTSQFGSTDANGHLIIPGTWDASNVGVWQETWQVGSSTPAQLNFSIVPSTGVSGLGNIIELPSFGGGKGFSGGFRGPFRKSPVN